MATCPECEYDEIDTEDFEEGDNLSCPECGKGLVVVGVDEIEVVDDEEDLVDDVVEDEEEPAVAEDLEVEEELEE